MVKLFDIIGKGLIKLSVKRIESLDSLRGISAVIVVIFHCMITFSILDAANYSNHFANSFIELISITPLHIFWAGKQAVFLFFVLSGFVLTLPFLNTNRTEFSYKGYVLKRFLRIYIPYILIVTISSILVTLCLNYRAEISLSDTYNNRWSHPIHLISIFAYLIMFDYDLSNINGVMWSLVHEMRISLLIPFIGLFIKRNKLLKSLLVTLGLTTFLWVSLKIIFPYINNDLIRLILESISNTFYYAIFFIFGSFLAKYQNNIIKFLKGNYQLYLVAVLSFLFITNEFIIKGLIFYTKMSILYKIPLPVQELFVGIGVVLLFAIVLSSKKVDKYLSRPIFLWLGKVSYSLYLSHIIILMLSSIFLSNIVSMSIAIIAVPFIAIPFAGIVYRYVEYPAIVLAKKVNYRKANKTIAAEKQAI